LEVPALQEGVAPVSHDQHESDLRPGPPRPPEAGVMLCWTVYRSPLDYPDSVVVRGFYIRRDSPIPLPRPEVHQFGSIEDARRWIQRDPTLVCVTRSESDPASIVETWL
jgi:hypothetical protein